VNLSKEHFIPTQKLTSIVSLKKTQNKGKKKEKKKIHRTKNINLFSQTLMKCTNDEIMVDPKHDCGGHKSCECNK
jgi:hypothetical protein